jgi:lipid-A-disaccharide synthase
MKLLVSALEPSANLHLENLFEHLHGIELAGIFDEKFGKPIYSPKSFGVMGVIDVIGKIFAAKKAIKELTALAAECDKVLLIDAPAFNIPFAKAIKKAYPDKQIIYYILPKVWAWKKGRIATVEACTDVQAYIFPFERQFWAGGIYVGNPLMEEIRTLKTAPCHSVETTAFLPGSRRSEIKALMPVFRECARQMDGKKILSIPPIFDEHEIAALYGDISAFEVSFDAKEALVDADRAVVCSGTATLEAAIVGVPFVLVYKAKKLDYFLGRLFVKLVHVGLANIIFDFDGMSEFHAELLQETVTPENIKAELEKINPDEFFAKSQQLRNILSQKDRELHELISIV